MNGLGLTVLNILRVAMVCLAGMSCEQRPQKVEVTFHVSSTGDSMIDSISGVSIIRGSSFQGHTFDVSAIFDEGASQKKGFRIAVPDGELFATAELLPGKQTIMVISKGEIEVSLKSLLKFRENCKSTEDSKECLFEVIPPQG